MSLVNTNTGEVVDLLDAGQALALVKKIGGQLDRVNVETGSLVELVADAPTNASLGLLAVAS